MVILRGFLSLLAGFATMAALVIVVTALLTRMVPEWVGGQGKPRLGYIFVNLGYSFLAAVAGGYVTALTAAGSILAHVLALAIAVLVLSALSALQMRGKQPIAYQLTLLAISPLGVAAGGFLRLRILGII